MRLKLCALVMLMAVFTAFPVLAETNSTTETNTAKVTFDYTVGKDHVFTDFGRIAAPKGNPNQPNPNEVFTVQVSCAEVYIELNPLPCGEVNVHLYYKESETGSDGKATLFARVTRVNGSVGFYTIAVSRKLTISRE